MKISFCSPCMPQSGTICVGVYEDLSACAQVHEIKGLKEYLEKSLKINKFKGKSGEFFFAGGFGEFDQVLCVGLGKKENLNDKISQEIGATVLKALKGTDVAEACVLLAGVGEEAAIAGGALMRSWSFDKYVTKKKEESSLKSLCFCAQDVDQTKKNYAVQEALAEGISLTRTVVSEPPNVIYPESFAAEAMKLKDLGLKVEVLDVEAMKKLGMGALLGVGQGSNNPPRLVSLEWKGGQGNPVAFVGKGITFDSGGLNIKTSSMEEMKWDMGGAGVVIGLMKALALRKAPVNAVGILALAENMPSGAAQRPSDIVTSMSGQTIEILNTDAEGRLVLCDALSYVQDQFKPKAIVDLATLTMAIIIALGHHKAGLFCNDDTLASQLYDAGEKTGENLWRLPLGPEYDKELDSTIADVQNIAGPGRGAGSITAAQFLQRFIKDTPWAHIDIAGTAWTNKDRPLTGKGATAFGVRLLNQWVKDHYEA